MSKRGEVLVAIINNKLDYAILRERLWYRIPVSSVEKWIKGRWPPKWLAFYQTIAFGAEKHAINYFAEVLDFREVDRWQLFPNEPRDEKRNRRYYQIFVKSVQPLPKPIYSRRYRRIIFIPTTREKFINASEINDLFDESSLEDKLWAEFKRHNIPAERQDYVVARKNDYALDFAIYCAKGNIDVETDGDFWHANPEKAAKDNLRDHDLNTAGWKVLHFSEKQIQEQAASYCVKTVVENINKLGGVDEGKVIPRKINLDRGSYQPSLFDGLENSDET
jgi:very-short-patch-repair endonuclease